MKTAVSVPEAAAPTGMKLPVSAAAAQSQRQPEPPSTSGKNPVSAEFTEAEPYFSPAVISDVSFARITILLWVRPDDSFLRNIWWKSFCNCRSRGQIISTSSLRLIFCRRSLFHWSRRNSRGCIFPLYTIPAAMNLRKHCTIWKDWWIFIFRI